MIVLLVLNSSDGDYVTTVLLVLIFGDCDYVTTAVNSVQFPVRVMFPLM